MSVSAEVVIGVLRVNADAKKQADAESSSIFSLEK